MDRATIHPDNLLQNAALLTPGVRNKLLKRLAQELDKPAEEITWRDALSVPDETLVAWVKGPGISLEARSALKSATRQARAWNLPVGAEQPFTDEEHLNHNLRFSTDADYHRECGEEEFGVSVPLSHLLWLEEILERSGHPKAREVRATFDEAVHGAHQADERREAAQEELKLDWRPSRDGFHLRVPAAPDKGHISATIPVIASWVTTLDETLYWMVKVTPESGWYAYRVLRVGADNLETVVLDIPTRLDAEKSLLRALTKREEGASA